MSTRLVRGLIVMTLVLAACGPSAPGGTAAAGPTGSTQPTEASSPTASPRPTKAAVHLPAGRLVFNRHRGNPEGRYQGTYVLDSNGVETTLSIPGEAFERFAVWSADGTRLLVTSWFDDKPSVGIFDPTSLAFAPVTVRGAPGIVSCSDWSPDGSTLLCRLEGTDPEDDGVIAVDLATGKMTRLTRSPYHATEGTAGGCGGGDYRGVYSPDGSRIAFIRQRCGTGPDPAADETGAIVVIDADGSNPATILPVGVRTHPGSELSWSPTGDQIVYGTQSGRLAVIGADGSGQRTLDVAPGAFIFDPVWSPDGTSIVVTIGASGSDNLYLVAADGSTFDQLTFTGDTEVFSDWAP